MSDSDRPDSDPETPLPRTAERRRAGPSTLDDPPDELWTWAPYEPGDAEVMVDDHDAWHNLTFDDRYEHKQALGAGGMGEVNLCTDHAIGRDVAMKVIKPRADRSQAVMHRRFVREARIQGQLEHPSIVPVHDVGVDPEGALYFTMKRIRGRSLDTVLIALRNGDPDTTRQYSLRKLLSLLSRVCMTIDFAHSRGVVHRDLKPANIMLGDFGEVYVLDWGVSGLRSCANIAWSEATEETAQPIVDFDGAPRTVDGQVIGTVGYMAPEQLKGDIARVDSRSDVYALGLILFEIVTRTRAHPGLKLADVMVSTMASDGLVPSVRAPGRDVPPELDRLCAHATRLSPDDRIQSARALSAAIEAFLDGDRDVALRRDMAAQRAHAATDALARSRDPDADEEAERSRAMREVTTALGLDPHNPTALTTLVKLLTRPPRAMPRGAQQSLRQAAMKAYQLAGKAAIVVYFGFALYLPFTFWMGLRSWPAVVLMGGSITACAALTYYYLKRPPPVLQVTWPHLIVTTFTVIVSGVMFGPFILVPLLALGNTVGYISSLDGRRVPILLAGALGVAAPAVLQWAGVIRPSYVLEDGVMKVLPWMIDMPATPTLVFLLFSNVALTVTASLYVAYLRKSFTAAQRKLHLQAWQLSQIVPERARPLVT